MGAVSQCKKIDLQQCERTALNKTTNATIELFYRPGVTTNYLINRTEIEERYMRMNGCQFCEFKSFSIGNVTAASEVRLDSTGGISIRPRPGTTYFNYSGEFTTPSCEKVFPTKPVLNFKTTVCGNEVITEKDREPIRI
jgi:hypothetical protein